MKSIIVITPIPTINYNIPYHPCLPNEALAQDGASAVKLRISRIYPHKIAELRRLAPLLKKRITYFYIKILNWGLTYPQ